SDESVEVLELGEMLLRPPLVAHHVLVFQIEKRGDQAVPGVAHESELEAFGEQLGSQNGLKAGDGPVRTPAAKQAFADRSPGAFWDVDEDGLVLLNPVDDHTESEGVANLKTNTLDML